MGNLRRERYVFNSLKGNLERNVLLLFWGALYSRANTTSLSGSVPDQNSLAPRNYYCGLFLSFHLFTCLFTD
ncbi:rCG62955 [Rattus norvegicus]|uniref:RCG62955 n=1 Tax=Rattus norvegicus TaxID=10116 RepID=A6HNY6_RAT|nr:rCG62955 [Rattus norvegicus]